MLIEIPKLIAEVRKNIQCVTASQAVELCQQHKGKLIDVREVAEFEAAAVESAINIPRGILEMKISAMCPDDDQAIFIHCATGGRASLAAEQLQRIGYKNVWAIVCSFNDVVAANQ